MTYGSVFSGFGGLDLGLTRAGLECVWQVEINDFATQVLERHWPGLPRWRDIRDSVPAGIAVPDIIVGGDPCQENSNAAGGRVPAGASPAIHFLRIIAELRPRLVLRENPYPSRRSAPWSWHRFRSELESLGYAVLPFRLRACCLGAQHQRDRVFLLAELANTKSERPGQLRGVRCQTQSKSERQLFWAEIESRIPRTLDGIPDRVERLVGIGNAVDVEVGEWIGRRLMQCFEHQKKS